jgi:hypothetical protein
VVGVDMTDAQLAKARHLRDVTSVTVLATKPIGPESYDRAAPRPGAISTPGHGGRG